MAACAQCGKRANQRHSCPGCGKAPLCLNCECECRWWQRRWCQSCQLGDHARCTGGTTLGTSLCMCDCNAERRARAGT